MNDTQVFSQKHSTLPPLEEDNKDVSYDVYSQFTNIKETIDFIIDQIFMQKKLTPLCAKLILKRLLSKLATEFKLSFLNSLHQQTGGCAIDGPLSVTVDNIYMKKLENDIAVPLKPKLYKRYSDDMFNRKKS